MSIIDTAVSFCSLFAVAVLASLVVGAVAHSCSEFKTAARGYLIAIIHLAAIALTLFLLYGVER